MLPNILSSFRIALVPVFIAAYFADASPVKGWAVAVYAVAGVTDFLDGYIARKFKQTSELGKILDPLGDKLMQVAALVCITIGGLIPVWAVVTVAVKEILMGVGGIVIHKLQTTIPPSNILGKISTVSFLLVCIVLMLFPAMKQEWAAAFIMIPIALMLIALGSYVGLFINVMKKRKSKNEK